MHACRSTLEDPTNRTDSVLKYLPGSFHGGLRNFGYALCNTFSGGKACDPTEAEYANAVCTGIAEAAVEAIREAMRKGELSGIAEVDQISRRSNGVDHTAVLVVLADGTRLVMDWHGTLDPAAPVVTSAEQWCKGSCL